MSGFVTAICWQFSGIYRSLLVPLDPSSTETEHVVDSHIRGRGDHTFIILETLLNNKRTVYTPKPRVKRNIFLEERNSGD